MTPRNQPLSWLDHLFLIGAINRRYNVPYAVWGLVIFALCYLVPLVLCAFEGVLITAMPHSRSCCLRRLHGWRNMWAITRRLRAADRDHNRHQQMRRVAVALTALDSFDGVYQAVASPELLNVTESEVKTERSRAERWLNKRLVVVAFATAAVCGAALYLDGEVNIGWWGNPAYGKAGLVLAITIALAIFYGMHSLYLLAVAQHSISKGIKLRPFHPDGSTGFARLGNFLLLLLALCILCALAAWVTSWHGYLGIEDSPGIWLGAIGVVIFIPWTVIQPLIHVTREIRPAQMMHLAPVEHLLNTVLSKTEIQLGQPDFRITDIEYLKTLHDLHTVASEIYETNVFPFNRKVAGVLSIGYVLQVITLIKEVAGKFK